MRTRALELARAGRYVFPLRGKRPVTAHAQHDATRDLDLINVWWDKWPDAQIAINCLLSGFVVIDVDISNDRKGDESLRALEQLHGDLPLTRTVKTPGGYHLYYQPPPLDKTHKMRGGFGKLYKGIDIKYNGYVVAPGSEGYTLIQDTAPIELPINWQLATTREIQQHVDLGLSFPAADHATIQAAAAALDDWTGGSYVASCMLVNDWALSPVEALPILEAWNAKHKDPHDAAHLSAKIENALQHAEGERGLERMRHVVAIDVASAPPFTMGAGDDWSTQVLKAHTDLTNYRKITLDSKVRANPFKSLTELNAMTFPKQRWLIKGLIPTGTIGINGGPPKSTKTWNLIEQALAVSTGTKAFGEFVTQQGPVCLFLAEDLVQDARNRINATLHDHVVDGDPPIHIACRENLDLCDDWSVAWLIASARAHSPILVGLDPLRDLHTGDENQSGDMIKVLKTIRAISELVGCAVVVNHHTSKPSADSAKRSAGYTLRGSGAIFGSVDFLFTIRDFDEAPGEWSTRIETTGRSARFAGMFNLDLSVNDDDDGRAERAKWTFTRSVVPRTEKESKSLATDVLRIKSAMVDMGGGGAGADIRTASGMNKSRCYEILRHLTELGEVEARKTGFWLSDEAHKALLAASAT